MPRDLVSREAVLAIVKDALRVVKDLLALPSEPSVAREAMKTCSTCKRGQPVEGTLGGRCRCPIFLAMQRLLERDRLLNEGMNGCTLHKPQSTENGGSDENR